MAQGPRRWRYWNPTKAECLLRTLFEPAAPLSLPVKEPLEPTRRPDQQAGQTVGLSEPKKRLDEVLERLRGLNLTPTSSKAVGWRVQKGKEEVGKEWKEEYEGYSEEYESAEETLDLTACNLECGYCGRCMY